jgi:glutamate racemase
MEKVFMNIGFLDSGIGGLTVLREAIKALPHENFIYYADTLHVPYGTKPKEEAKRYIFEAVSFLAEQGIKALVIACNTATIIAINDLREKYSFPIIGIEPAIKPAVENNLDHEKRVLVLATPLALKEEKFKSLVVRVDKKNLVDVLPAPELVEFAESFMFDEKVIIPYFKEKLSSFNIKKYGTVVLGCTHFPIFSGTLRKILPYDIDIIDGSIGTINRLKSVMDELKITTNSDIKGKIVFYASGKKVSDKEKINKFMNLMKICD